MSEIEDIQNEESQPSEVENKLAKLGKYLAYSVITIIWAVSAGFSIRDLWQGKGIIETPWVILGIVLTLIIIVLVIIPLFRSLREDVRDYNRRKEAENMERKDVEEENN